MKTRDRILSTALELYNENTYSSVSTRTIAQKLNISGGNLHYHFTHSEDIITELFGQLETTMDALMISLKNKEDKNLETIFEFIESAFEVFYNYRFILLNFNEILSTVPEIEQSYQELQKRRKYEFLNIFKHLQKNAIFSTDIPDSFLENLITQIFILGDFWMIHNKFGEKFNKEESLHHYLKIFTQLFFGVLSENNKEEFLKKYR